jgi:hypothetical protein
MRTVEPIAIVCKEDRGEDIYKPTNRTTLPPTLSTSSSAPNSTSVLGLLPFPIIGEFCPHSKDQQLESDICRCWKIKNRSLRTMNVIYKTIIVLMDQGKTEGKKNWDNSIQNQSILTIETRSLSGNLECFWF